MGLCRSHLGLKRVPRGLKTALRALQVASRRLQERSTRLQDGSKSALRGFRTAQERSKRLQDGPKSTARAVQMAPIAFPEASRGLYENSTRSSTTRAFRGAPGGFRACCGFEKTARKLEKLNSELLAPQDGSKSDPGGLKRGLGGTSEHR